MHRRSPDPQAQPAGRPQLDKRRTPRGATVGDRHNAAGTVKRCATQSGTKALISSAVGSGGRQGPDPRFSEVSNASPSFRPILLAGLLAAAPAAGRAAAHAPAGSLTPAQVPVGPGPMLWRPSAGSRT